MKISHEVPICLLEESRRFNDYDYALVHLFEEQPKYYDFFERSVKEGREVILDNSIFELGKAFEKHRFIYWIRRLQPTAYIIPDSLENYKETIANAISWFEYNSDVPGEKIGVVQGKTLEEIELCYTRLLKLGVDRIAISFDYSLYQEIFPHPNKLVSWCFGRIRLVNHLISQRTIDETKSHHLLGCSLPQEFSYYQDEKYSFIKSLDTSNPITFSLDNKSYEDFTTILTKPKAKLFELIGVQMTSDQYKLILKNVEYFRKLVKS